MKDKYLVDVKNRYDVLSLETDEQVQDQEISKIEQKWQHLKESIQYANESAPKLEKKAKKVWMTDEILLKMDERKKAKNTPAYAEKNKEVQKLCKKEKDHWYNQKYNDIEKYLNQNGTKKMHNCIKELVGENKSKTATGCIKDKDGKMIFEKDKVLERWAEYVGELFADTRSSLPEPSNDRGPPIVKEEVEKAIKNSQLGKAPGEDGITTEMLKLLEDFGINKLTEASSQKTSLCLFSLRYQNNQERQTVPILGL